MLSHWPIRYKLLFGTAILCLIVATLAFSSFRGVYAYRELVRGISQRAMELEPASELTARVVELQFTLPSAATAGEFPGRRASGHGIHARRIRNVIVRMSKGALHEYQTALEQRRLGRPVYRRQAARMGNGARNPAQPRSHHADL